MIGIALHGAVTFVSGLHAGSMSDREIFKLSGIIKLLKPDMAIMVDKGFLVDNIAPCKVYQPAFVSACGEIHKENKRKQTVQQGHTIVCVGTLKNCQLPERAISQGMGNSRVTYIKDVSK